MQHGYRIRAHHGMCMLFFRGRGYNAEFTAHMAEVISALREDTPVEVCACEDDICAKCPNREGGVCDSAEKAAAYDRRVLELCGLTEGQTLSYGEFRKLINQNIIIPKERAPVCSDCEWNEVCTEIENGAE